MNLRLLKVQELNKKAQKMKTGKKLQNDYKKINRVLHHQKLPFILKIIETKLIN